MKPYGQEEEGYRRKPKPPSSPDPRWQRLKPQRGRTCKNRDILLFDSQGIAKQPPQNHNNTGFHTQQHTTTRGLRRTHVYSTAPKLNYRETRLTIKPGDFSQVSQQYIFFAVARTTQQIPAAAPWTYNSSIFSSGAVAVLEPKGAADPHEAIRARPDTPPTPPLSVAPVAPTPPKNASRPHRHEIPEAYIRHGFPGNEAFYQRPRRVAARCAAGSFCIGLEQSRHWSTTPFVGGGGGKGGAHIREDEGGRVLWLVVEINSVRVTPDVDRT